MRHPFELELSDLENVNSNLEEKITNEEAGKVLGRSTIEGRIRYPKPPIYTTLTLGEEGGRLTTLAIGEEGGDLY